MVRHIIKTSSSSTSVSYWLYTNQNLLSLFVHDLHVFSKKKVQVWIIQFSFHANSTLIYSSISHRRKAEEKYSLALPEPDFNLK